MDIETIFPDPSSNGSAIGRVVAKEIRYNVTIDFEEFEVLYLTVRVRDLNTTIGQDYDECKFDVVLQRISISLILILSTLKWLKNSVKARWSPNLPPCIYGRSVPGT